MQFKFIILCIMWGGNFLPQNESPEERFSWQKESQEFKRNTYNTFYILENILLLAKNLVDNQLESTQFFLDEKPYEEYLFIAKEPFKQSIVTIDDLKNMGVLDGMFVTNKEQLLLCIASMANCLLKQNNKKKSLLLIGPPGTGKTIFAKELVRTLGAIIPQGTRLRITSVGKLLRLHSTQAIYELKNLLEFASQPGNFVFIDEFDLLLQNRHYLQKYSDDSLDKEFLERLLSLQIDFISRTGSGDLNIIVASNSFHYTDESFPRRFFFQEKFYLPKLQERREITKFYLRKMGVHFVGLTIDVVSKWIAARTARFSPSDLENFCKKLSNENNPIPPQLLNMYIKKITKEKSIIGHYKEHKIGTESIMKEKKNNLLEKYFKANYYFNRRCIDIINYKKHYAHYTTAPCKKQKKKTVFWAKPMIKKKHAHFSMGITRKNNNVMVNILPISSVRKSFCHHYTRYHSYGHKTSLPPILSFSKIHKHHAKNR